MESQCITKNDLKKVFYEKQSKYVTRIKNNSQNLLIIIIYFIFFHACPVGISSGLEA